VTSAWLIPDLEHDEGLRLAAYQDSVGIWTIGYGHAHVQPGTVWTLEQAQAQLATDVAGAEADLDAQLSWWRSLSDLRQDCLANQCFNMGIGSLLTFTTYLGLVKAGNYAAAAQDELHTKWAVQVGARAARLAEQMRTGVHQVDGARPPAPAAAPVEIPTGLPAPPAAPADPFEIPPAPLPPAPQPAPAAPSYAPAPTYSNWENALHVVIAAVVPVFGSLFVLILRLIKARKAQATARAAPPSA
jgi:lysozyme